MHAVLRSLGFFLFTVLGLLSLVPTAWSIEGREEILVGRTTYVEGDLLRYVPEEKDWVLTDIDAPFGLEDTLYAGDGARAELSLPNGTWLRLGEQTQVQMIDLVSDATAVDVASGQARFYSNSNTTVIKATTPFGSIMAPAGSVFDLYVGDESLEVIAVRGEVVFVHDATKQHYSVTEGRDSIIADQQGVTSGNGTVDGDWDDWNNQRETLWSQRMQGRSTAANLLPEPIRQDAYSLEENGRWERVYYDGVYRDMWRPTQVASGWQPFTVGRWVNYYGDNCWIPGEPFGYLTHHYGSWIYVDSFRTWYWLPPVVRRSRSTSALGGGFGWYPGRVGWFSHGSEIGWVPLAPNEDYYGYRHWGHRTKVIGHRIPMINPARYRYLSHAFVVERAHLYGRHRAPQSQRHDLRKSGMLNQFKPMTAWQEFKGDKRRYTFTDREAKRKPHALTLDRIDYNRKRLQAGERVDRQRVERDFRNVKARHELPKREDRHRPQVSGKMVDADSMTRPMDRTNLPRKEIKPQERERRPSRDTRAGFGRNAGSDQNRQPIVDNRQERLQPPSNAGSEREQRPDPIKDRRQIDQPENQRKRLDQDSRRRDPQPDISKEQPRERSPQSRQVENQEQRRQRDAFQGRQEEDRRQRDMESRQQRERQQRQEEDARQQRANQDRRERQETQQRQRENEERDRQQSVQRQQQQHQQLQRSQQDEQQRRDKMERRRQQELEQQQQEQKLQKGQQREARQRQEEQQARQSRDEEQQRLRQRSSREAKEPRDEQSQPKKKRQRTPFEEEQSNQPL